VPTIYRGSYVAPGRGGNGRKWADLPTREIPEGNQEGLKIRSHGRGGFDWKVLNERKIRILRAIWHDAHAGDSCRYSVPAELLGWSDKTWNHRSWQVGDMVASAAIR